MTEMVACAECGAHYDSDAITFCSSCGNTKRLSVAAQETATKLATKRHPRRRKGHQGAIIVLSMSAILTLMLLAALPGMLSGNLQDLEAAYDRSSVEVVVEVRNGTPVEFAQVTAWWQDVEQWNGTTDADGLVTIPTLEHGQFLVRVVAGNQTLEQTVRAWDVGIKPTDNVKFDFAANKVTVPSTLKEQDLALTTYVMLGVLGTCAIAGLMGSIQFLRGKSPASVAIGSSLGFLPWLMVAFAGIFLGTAGMLLVGLALLYIVGSIWMIRSRIKA